MDNLVVVQLGHSMALGNTNFYHEVTFVIFPLPGIYCVDVSLLAEHLHSRLPHAHSDCRSLPGRHR